MIVGRMSLPSTTPKVLKSRPQLPEFDRQPSDLGDGEMIAGRVPAREHLLWQERISRPGPRRQFQDFADESRIPGGVVVYFQRRMLEPARIHLHPLLVLLHHGWVFRAYLGARAALPRHRRIALNSA